MLMLKSKEMREQRAKLIADARAALKGELTPEIRTQLDKMNADIDQLEKDIALYEAQEQRERELATKTDAIVDPAAETRALNENQKKAIEEEARKYSDAFYFYAQHGETALSAEQRSILAKGYRVIPEGKTEGRAQTITTTGGGYVIPQGFMAELERAMKYYGGVLDVARILNTASGNPIPWPTVDDTGNTGEDSTINTNASEQDITLGQKILGAYKIDSGLIQVPTELFEDSGINLDSELSDMLGERLGRRRNNKYTVGAGTTTFQGCVVGASAGVTFVGTAAFTADELITLQHKVDPAYRKSPKAVWMMNDDSVRFTRQLKDGNGRYLLDFSTLPGMPTTLLGKPLVINQDMATLATGQKTVLFGDFSKFVVRNVRAVVIRRLNELFAQADQIGFLAWYRGDSQLVSASSKALVYGIQS